MNGDESLNASIPCEEINLVELSSEQHSILCGEQERLFALNHQNQRMSNNNMAQEQNEILEQIQLCNTVDVDEQYRILSEIRKKNQHHNSNNIAKTPSDTATDPETSCDENDFEEQRKILEQIQLEKRVGSGGQRDVLERCRIGYALEQRSENYKQDEQYIEIKNNIPDTQNNIPVKQPGISSPSKSDIHSNSYKILQPCAAVLKTGHLVPLHGPEVTRQAIAEGQAATIQCPQCLSWLQIKKDATLMFCPCCSRLSPVIIPETKVDIHPEKVYPVTSDAGKVIINPKDSKNPMEKGKEQNKQSYGCFSCLERCFDQIFRLFGI